jgi:glyoxylase-like metal-dependent hydrolase (beta-lactamase superfamily II)/rhodanese-related sulfurtransferase
MNGNTSNAGSTVPRGERIEPVPHPLVIRQLYLGCLSQASYLVGDRSTGRAIAVDPRRDVDELLQAAADEHLTIELIVETHFHADFLSGHLELADKTAAPIAVGAAGDTEFESRRLSDGDVVDLGSVQVEVWATPGHTPESISLVVRPAPGDQPAAVLTGDTLFIGDVGRPDLLVAADIPAQRLGAQLYDSIGRLARLPDATLVLPAHGAGSACGKALSSETMSTIGQQRHNNWALAPLSKERFIELVTDGQPATPGYFGYDAALNRQTRPLMEERPLNTMDLHEVDAATANGTVVVDVRPATEFAAGHLAGSLGIALDGRFAEQAGSVIDPATPIVLVGDADAVAEARVRLARIGFDHVLGALTDLESALTAHPDRARHLSRLTTTSFIERKQALGERLAVIDVRNPDEVAVAPIAHARNIPLARLRHEIAALDRSQPTVVLCAGGARSAIASSVLLGAGFEDVSDVLGGANALATAANGHAASCS